MDGIKSIFNTLGDFKTPVLWILPAVGISLAWVYSGADLWLARVVVADEGSSIWQWAWWMRQHATQPAVWVSVVAFLYLLTPWQLRQPFMRQVAAVWLITLVFGAGLVNQVILQEVFDRARPRDVFEAIGSAAALTGHSFPSGHAAMGFVFLAPFFVIRNKWRWVFLAGGVLWGSVVGYARMVVGAHYVTDVLWAGVICVVTAWVAVKIIPHGRAVHRWILGALLAIAVAGIVLGNKFTLTLRWEGPAATVIDLNCGPQLPLNFEVPTMEVVYQISGYGAPLSNLVLVEREGILTLRRWLGVYHSLKCEKLEVIPVQSLDAVMNIP